MEIQNILNDMCGVGEDKEYILKMFKKLEEENKKLEEEVNDRVVIEDIAEAFGSDEGEDFDWESEIAGLVEENKKLKEENKRLKEENKNVKKNALKQINKLNKKTKELQKEIEKLEMRLEDTLTTSILKGLQIPEDEEEEVETCCECNTKRECLSDMFVTIRELNGTESVMCGMCSLNHFESKALQ